MPAKKSGIPETQAPKPIQPSKSGLTGDWMPVAVFSIQPRKRKGKVRWVKVQTRFPKPAPGKLLLRVCPNLRMKEFKALKMKLRALEMGDGNLRAFLLAGYFLAWLSLKKEGRKHSIPKPSGFIEELEGAASKLALLCRLSEEIRGKIANAEVPFVWPDDFGRPEPNVYRDVILNAPEAFEALRQGTESFVKEWKRDVHPNREIDERLRQIEEALRPLKGDDLYGHVYNSRWALTEELVSAFGGNISRKAIEKRAKRKSF